MKHMIRFYHKLAATACARLDVAFEFELAECRALRAIEVARTRG
jgi:hypothetical protein